MPPGLLPNHKASIVTFLDRVYGIEDQITFYRLIDEAFLPDLRAATTLDMVSQQREETFGSDYQGCCFNLSAHS